MSTQILWTGREYHSLENCLVAIAAEGMVVHSTIIGYYEGNIYQVAYQIRANPHWETLAVEVHCRINNRPQDILLKSDGKGRWTRDGNYIPAWDGCMDVDIPLTPFTNSLPIHRLQLPLHKSQEISVVYIDLLAGHITPVRQHYTRLSDHVYHYENVPNDFEADILVDEAGFVVDYPSLFARTSAFNTDMG